MTTPGFEPGPTQAEVLQGRAAGTPPEAGLPAGAADAGGPFALASAGGKDSTLALARARAAGLDVEAGLVIADARGAAGFHGVPAPVVARQMKLMGLDPRIRQHQGPDFETVFLAALRELAEDGIRGIVFGNLHLADVRAWYEERTRGAGLLHVEPLWGMAPADVVRSVVEEGWTARIVAVMTTPPDPGAHGDTQEEAEEDEQEEAQAGQGEGAAGAVSSEVALAGTGTGPAIGEPAWLGRVLDRGLLEEMEARGIDLAGERGEYHTLVTDGPAFATPLEVRTGPVEHRSGHALLTWSPEESHPDRRPASR